jgi:hypothetical protein
MLNEQESSRGCRAQIRPRLVPCIGDDLIKLWKHTNQLT